MEVGTELSVQIKKAIKAKLQEMQCYVDDELPDYIMVMIANKKTTQQMTDDLKIFLSEKSVTFCEWLGEVLERLDKVGDGKDSSKHDNEKSVKGQENTWKARSRSPSAKKKSKTSPRGTSRSKSPTGGEKRSYKETKPSHSSSSTSRRAITDSDNSLAKKRQGRYEEKDAIEQKLSPPRCRKRRSNTRSTGRGAKSSERKSVEVKKRPITTEDSELVLGDKRQFIPEYKQTGTKIVIKNEYNQEQVHDKSENTTSVVDDTLRDASPLSSDENEQLVANSPEEIVAKEKPIWNSAILTKNQSLKRQRVSAKERIVTGQKQTGVVMPLVVVNNKNTQSDLRARLEQRHQRKVSAISKRTSTRRLDRSLSNLNTIFSKALQNVTTLEISSSEKHEEYDPLEPDISETGRLKMDVMSIPRVTVQNENAEVEILRLAAKKSRRTLGRKKLVSENSDDGNRSKREASVSGDDSDLQRDRVVVPETSPERDERSKSTKFVVSLKGASKFLDKLIEQGNVSDDEISRSDQESAKSDKKDVEATLDDSYNDKSSTKDSRVKTLKAADFDGSVSGENDVSESVNETTSSGRCKFWPNCKLRHQCAYLHPPCRFAASCTNVSCTYSHPKSRHFRKRPVPHTEAPYALPTPGGNSFGSRLAGLNYVSVAPSGDITCKYGTKCKSDNCPFLHPKVMKDCAFGVSCRRKSTGCRSVK